MEASGSNEHFTFYYRSRSQRPSADRDLCCRVDAKASIDTGQPSNTEAIFGQKEEDGDLRPQRNTKNRS